MKFKYVITDYGRWAIFDCATVHKDIANRLGYVVAAGFIHIDKDCVSCFGESVSCEVKSRGEEDSKFFAQMFGMEVF